MMKKYPILAILMILLIGGMPWPSYAGDAGRESHFSIGVGVRAVGMGGGFVGLADDATAVYWNQAALAGLDNQELNLMHVTLFEGTIYDAATFVYPDPNLGGFGIGFMRLGTGDIVKRVDWNDVGQFSFSTWQMIFGYGRKLEGGHSLGAAVKIVNQSMAGNSTYGAGLDISFFSKIQNHISAGILFQDIISPRLRLGENAEIMPATVAAGVGINNIKFGEGFVHNFGVQLEKTETRSLKIRMGAESIYRNYLALRAGYDRDNLAFGLGIYYQRLRFDYAYKFLNGLSDSHRLGLSILIGRSISEKIRLEKELESARGSTLILEDRKRQSHFYQELGDRYYRNNSLDSAYVYYQRSLAFDQQNREVRGRISQIDEIRQATEERAQKEFTGTDRVTPLIDSYYLQADLLRSKGSYLAAFDLIAAGLSISPGNQKFLALKEKVASERDTEIRRLTDNAIRAEKEARYVDAITYYNRILEYQPDNVAIKQMVSKAGAELNNYQLLSKGMELFSMGNLSDAKRRFEEVQRTDPNNVVALEYINRISILMKEATELEDLQKDDKVWKIYLDALEYFRNGDYENAIRLWEEVLRYYPGNKNTINNIEQARLRLQSK
jgi:tetratricopeptide (TPR) repeat protein